MCYCYDTHVTVIFRHSHLNSNRTTEVCDSHGINLDLRNSFVEYGIAYGGSQAYSVACVYIYMYGIQYRRERARYKKLGKNELFASLSLCIVQSRRCILSSSFTCSLEQRTKGQKQSNMMRCSIILVKSNSRSQSNREFRSTF